MPGSSDTTPEPSRRASVIVVFVALGLIMLVVASRRITRTAELAYEGRPLSVPLSIWSVRVADDGGMTRYVGLGDPSFGSSEDLEYVEQMGSVHVFRSHDLRLDIITSKRSRYLTEMSFHLYPE